MAIIDKKYEQAYTNIFSAIIKDSSLGFYDEIGILSYTHKNKLMSWLFWKRIETALGLIKDETNKKVLDFGCGSLIIFKYLIDKGHDVTGCENKYYELSREISRKLCLSTHIHRELQEIQTRKFDIIFALDVFEHIDDIDSYLQLIKTIAHKDSLFILSGPTENIFYKIGRFLSGFSGKYHSRNIYQIENILKTKKFKLKKNIELFPFLPLFRVSSWQMDKSQITNI